MAKTNNTKSKSPNTQGSDKDNKNGILAMLLPVLTAIIVMLLVVGGAFYYVIHNNINNSADMYREKLQTIPILKLALPAVPDPEDPKYLTDKELKVKYNELRLAKKELLDKVSQSEKTVQELQKKNGEIDSVKQENEKLKKDVDLQKQDTESKLKSIEDEKKKLSDMIAAGDKAGFKAYFEKVDKETATKVYTDIIKQQKLSEDMVKFTQIYEAMDVAASAKIFQDMGVPKIDLVVDIMKNLKKETTAGILAAMDANFSGKVTEKLSKSFTTK